jgi:hypothetical protein
LGTENCKRESPVETKQDPLKPGAPAPKKKKKKSKKKKWGPIPDSVMSSATLKDGKSVKYCGDNCLNHLNERLAEIEGSKECWF